MMSASSTVKTNRWKEILDRFVQLSDAYSTVSVNFRTAEDSIAVTSLT
jgi:hypothetical protein